MSYYEEIGGSAAVRIAVDMFYGRVLADPSLVDYFTGVDLGRVKRHQALLITQVLGGPSGYPGAPLGVAHERLGITDEAFDRVVGHLVGTLAGLGVPGHVVDHVTAELAPTRAEIVAHRSLPA